MHVPEVAAVEVDAHHRLVVRRPLGRCSFFISALLAGRSLLLGRLFARSLLSSLPVRLFFRSIRRTQFFVCSHRLARQ